MQVVNFGAWYPRYSVLDPHHPWPAWQKDMKELLMERLAGYKARTFWRSYAAAHYGGTNGTNTFEEVCTENSKVILKVYCLIQRQELAKLLHITAGKCVTCHHLA